jgi:triacylglycerol esterase/lipase EstA (alpha/beta hydrolase family)
MIKRPLIFIPGIMGSKLAIKEGNFLDSFWPPIQPELSFSNAINKILNGLKTKVRTKVDEEVPVQATDLFPMAYDAILGAINQWGYILNINFWTFPYDWRQSNEISAQQLTEFIKQKIKDTDWNDVDIICHSMGGFITRAALKLGAPIKKTIYIASPHFGSPLSYFTINPEIRIEDFTNSFEQLAIETIWSSFFIGGGETVLERQLKEIFGRFPSMYELLPDDLYLDKNPMIFNNNQPINGVNNTYLNNPWGFKDEDMINKVTKAMEFKKRLGEELPGNDEDILLIYALDRVTFNTIQYFSNDLSNANNNKLLFSNPVDSGEHGDTWVPTKSAMASMSGIPKYKNSKSISDIHTMISNNINTINEIREFLSSAD